MQTMTIVTAAALAVVLAPPAAGIAPIETEDRIVAVGVDEMPDVGPGDRYHLATALAL